MEVEELFVRASQSFQDRNYQEGLDVISQCIQQEPNNSLLYSNRGLFYAQLGENQSASSDLEKAIELNHLNYVAYFNLFSLQFRLGQEEQAFDNLCCSLSSLYLLRAKKSRRELDVQRSISYADNNFEAYILKSLMYLEDGRSSQALNYMEWACDINPKSILCQKLKNIVAKKVDPYAPDELVEGSEEICKGIRLKGSFKVEENMEGELVEKVKEFIEIYNQILGEEGTVTQKVPRTMLQNDKTLQKSKISTISGIYEFKLRSSKMNDAVGYSRGKVSSQAPTKEHLPEEQQKQYNILDEHQDSSINELTKNNNILSNKYEDDEENQQNLLDGSLEQKYQNEENNKKEKLFFLEDQEENLLDDPQPNIKVEEVKDSFDSTPQYTVKNSKMSSQGSSRSVSLYPIGNRKKIQFTVIGAEIKNPLKMKDFYVSGNYHSRKGHRLRTQIKKRQNNKVEWFSVNPPTTLSQTKQTLSVQLFSKQYFSVHDQLIGDGQIEIIRSGEIKIPVYYRAKVTGFVTIRVDQI